MAKEKARYYVLATAKAGLQTETPQVEFIVEDTGHKEAWVNGRNVTRQGGTYPTPDGKEIEVKAGMYTVRDVKSIDKRAGGRAKAKVITAQDFIAAAQAQGFELKGKLLHIAKEMGVMPAEATPETKPEEAAA